MGKQNIVLDIDGTLANNGDLLMQMITRELGIAPTVVDDYNISKCFPSEYQGAVGSFVKEVFTENVNDIYGKAPPYEDAVEVVNALGERIVGYATRRPASTTGVTKQWLIEHGFPDLPLFHPEKAISKIDVALDLGAGIIIEDSPFEAEEIAASDLSVILMNRRYNQNIRTSNWLRARREGRVRRAFSWKHVYTILTGQGFWKEEQLCC